MSETIKVLVADDEEIGRQLLEAILLPEGYDIVFGSNGREAVDVAINENPDIILLDVMMPVMDGFEACIALRDNSKTAHIPIFLITALDDRDSRIKGIDSGADDYISKPLDRIEILGKIKNKTTLIRKQQTRSGSDSPCDPEVQNGGTRSPLGDTLIRQILPIPYSKNVLVGQSKEIPDSQHAFFQTSVREDDFFLLISNKLEEGNSATGNAIFSNIWGKVLSISDIESRQTIKKSLIELDDLIKENSLELLTSADYSFLQIYHPKGSEEIRISGLNQKAFIMLQETGSYTAYSLTNGQETSFSGPGNLIAFSPQVSIEKGEQDILSFLNSELLRLPPEKIVSNLQTQYSEFEDLLTANFEF